MRDLDGLRKEPVPGPEVGAVTGVVAALPGELGELGVLGGGKPWSGPPLGTPIFETTLPVGGRILAVASGVGKVAAAGAAAGLVAAGATRLLVVGTCGGLRAQETVGALIHARRAVQWDLATRHGRELTADEALMEAWRAIIGGERGCILTADRPVIRFLDRLRVARAAAKTEGRSRGRGHGDGRGGRGGVPGGDSLGWPQGGLGPEAGLDGALPVVWGLHGWVQGGPPDPRGPPCRVGPAAL